MQTVCKIFGVEIVDNVDGLREAFMKSLYIGL